MTKAILPYKKISKKAFICSKLNIEYIIKNIVKIAVKIFVINFKKALPSPILIIKAITKKVAIKLSEKNMISSFLYLKIILSYKLKEHKIILLHESKSWCALATTCSYAKINNIARNTELNNFSVWFFSSNLLLLKSIKI